MKSSANALTGKGTGRAAEAVITLRYEVVKLQAELADRLVLRTDDE